MGRSDGPGNKKGNGAPFPSRRVVARGATRPAAPAATTATKVRPPGPEPKRTLPSVSANSVWSRPMPTLRPGCHLVPRWRMMMLPGTTCSPPNFLTPSRLPAVSRPLRELPPAFLCAIACLLRACDAALRERDVLDPQHRLQLAVAALATIVLAPLLLEHDHLGRPGLLQHLGRDLGAIDQRRADPGPPPPSPPIIST